jgi:succinate dehydrogenase / fumarate reductase, cytochrome b subunit
MHRFVIVAVRSEKCSPIQIYYPRNCYRSAVSSKPDRGCNFRENKTSTTPLIIYFICELTIDMQWSNFYASSIGRKLIMTATGLFLMAFLTVHLGLNATILNNDGGVLFDRTAYLFRHNWGLHILEILVFGGFMLHIGEGAALTLDNRSKRSIPYAVSSSFSLAPARSMGILGAIIFAFLLLHLYQFWLPKVIGSAHETASESLSQLVRSTMSQWWVVVIYVMGCIAVAAHLLHGWRSAAITLGVADRYLKLLSASGIIFAIVIPLGLASIPIARFMR